MATSMHLFLQLLLVGSISRTSKGDEGLQVGKAINLLSRFGVQYFTMKVAPVLPTSTDEDKWFFTELARDVFTNVSSCDAPTSVPQDYPAPAGISNGDYDMVFCKNQYELIQMYFRDFHFEKLDKPWRTFSGSWKKFMISRYMGIDEDYLSDEFSYVLLRFTRKRDHKSMFPIECETDIEEDVKEYADAVEVGNETSVRDFFANVGTHYILSYTTGNFLYQVFAYESSPFVRMQDKFMRKGLDNLSRDEITFHFSPMYALHIGHIKSASGNRTVESWANKILRTDVCFYSYSSLIHTYRREDMIQCLQDKLGNEAILAMDLRTLAPAIKDNLKRSWFLEVLDNTMKFYESNLEATERDQKGVLDLL